MADLSFYWKKEVEDWYPATGTELNEAPTYELATYYERLMGLVTEAKEEKSSVKNWDEVSVWEDKINLLDVEMRAVDARLKERRKAKTA